MLGDGGFEMLGGVAMRVGCLADAFGHVWGLRIFLELSGFSDLRTSDWSVWFELGGVN